MKNSPSSAWKTPFLISVKFKLTGFPPNVSYVGDELWTISALFAKCGRPCWYAILPRPPTPSPVFDDAKSSKPLGRVREIERGSPEIDLPDLETNSSVQRARSKRGPREDLYDLACLQRTHNGLACLPHGYRRKPRTEEERSARESHRASCRRCSPTRRRPPSPSL